MNKEKRAGRCNSLVFDFSSDTTTSLQLANPGRLFGRDERELESQRKREKRMWTRRDRTKHSPLSNPSPGDPRGDELAVREGAEILSPGRVETAWGFVDFLPARRDEM
jgi:hypothetical protein